MTVDLGKLFVALLVGLLCVVVSFVLLKHTLSPIEPDAPKKEPVAARKLLYFGASWCAPCRRMQPTLSDPKVVKAFGDMNTALCKYDVDKDRDLSKKYAVQAVPTYILLGADGKELKRGTGYRSASDFAAWITGKAEAKEIDGLQ